MTADRPRGPSLAPTFERTLQFNEDVERVRAADPEEADKVEAAVQAIVVDPGPLFPRVFDGQAMEVPAVTARTSLLVVGTFFDLPATGRRRLHIVFDAVVAMDHAFNFLHTDEDEELIE